MDHFHYGETIHVDIDFTDNVELASYKIDIHYDGDGYSHGRFSSMAQAELDPWDYEVKDTLSEKSQNVHLDITVPNNVKEGEYHFGVIALDKAGNQSTKYIDIDIHDHD